MKTAEEIIKQVNEEFREYSIWADASKHFNLNCIIDVDVDGDWKHEHLAVQHIMKNYNCSLISQEEIGEGDSDCYHAIHHYFIESE